MESRFIWVLTALAAAAAGCASVTGAHHKTELLRVAATLEGYRSELPCRGLAFVTTDDCDEDLAAVPAQIPDPKNRLHSEVVRTLEGDSHVVYRITLRLRGLMEPNVYAGPDGLVDAAATVAPHLHVGGHPVGRYNVYRLSVSSPEEVYYLNAYPRTGHLNAAVDYKFVIRARGGATVTVSMIDDNGIAIANFKKLIIPDLPPAPSPFNGQFIHLNVLDVAAE